MKRFVVKLRKGGSQGNVLATSQVITIDGLGDSGVTSGDFVDGVIAGPVQTLNGSACIVKTITTPKYSIVPLSVSISNNTYIVTASKTANFGISTSLTGLGNNVAWSAVFPDTTVTYTGGGLEVTSGRTTITGFSGSLKITTLPVNQDKQFQVVLWSGDVGTSVVLARSVTTIITPIRLTLTGPSTAVTNQPITVVVTGYNTDRVTIQGASDSFVVLDVSTGQKVVDLSMDKTFQPGVYRWTARGEITPGTVEYNVTVIDMFGKIEYPKDGVPGTPGTPGTPATPGVPGDSGTPATPGVPGDAGIPGTPGSDGPIIVVNNANVTVISTTTTTTTRSLTPPTISLTYKVSGTLTKTINETNKPTISIEYIITNRNGRTVTAKIAGEASGTGQTTLSGDPIIGVPTDDNDFLLVRKEITNDAGTIEFTANTDQKTEGTEHFRVYFYTDVNGNPFFQSDVLSILDTSTTPITPLAGNLVEYDPKITSYPSAEKFVGDTVKEEITAGPPGAEYTVTMSGYQLDYEKEIGQGRDLVWTSVDAVRIASTIRGFDAAQIAKQYFQTLKREPEEEGMKFWLNERFVNNKSLETVLQGIKNSTEAAKPMLFRTGTLDANGYGLITPAGSTKVLAPGRYRFDVTFTKFTGKIKTSTTRTYTWIVKPKSYDMKITPVGSTKDRYQIGLNQTFKIGITGGPPSATISIVKTSSVPGWAGTETIKLDANGNYTSGDGLFGTAGDYSYAMTLDPTTYIGYLTDRSASGQDSRTYIISATSNTPPAVEYRPKVVRTKLNAQSVLEVSTNTVTVAERFGTRITGGPPRCKFDVVKTSDNQVWKGEKLTGSLDNNGNFDDDSKGQAFFSVPGKYTFTITFLDYGNTVKFPEGPSITLLLTCVDKPKLTVSSDQIPKDKGDGYRLNNIILCKESDDVYFTFNGPSNAPFEIEELSPSVTEDKNSFFTTYNNVQKQFEAANPGKSLTGPEAVAFVEKFYTANKAQYVDPYLLSLTKQCRYFDFYWEAYNSWVNGGKVPADPQVYSKTWNSTFGNTLSQKIGVAVKDPDSANNLFTAAGKQTGLLTSKKDFSLNSDGVGKFQWPTRKEFAKWTPYNYRARLNPSVPNSDPNDWVYFGINISRDGIPAADLQNAISVPLKVGGQIYLFLYTSKELQAQSILIEGNRGEKVTWTHNHPNGVRPDSFAGQMIFSGDFVSPASTHTTKPDFNTVQGANGGGGSGPGVVIDDSLYPIGSTRLQSLGFPTGGLGLDRTINPRIGTTAYQFVGLHYGNFTNQIWISCINNPSLQPVITSTVTISIVETGKHYTTKIPPPTLNSDKKYVWINPAGQSSPIIDIYTGYKGNDPLGLDILRINKRSFTLVITNIGTGFFPFVLNNDMLSKDANIVNQIHPYMIIYHDVYDYYKTSKSTLTPTEYAVNHWNNLGANKPSYINPYRMQALISVPYFNYNPDVEQAWNQSNPYTATDSTGFNAVVAGFYAEGHWIQYGKTEGRLSPVDTAEKFRAQPLDPLPDIDLDTTTGKYTISWTQGDNVARTIPYVYTFDGDKSPNPVTVRVTVLDAQTRTTNMDVQTQITAPKVQPVPAKPLVVSVSPSRYLYQTVPVTVTFTGEPNDQIYVEYIDPKFNEDSLYVEAYQDLTDWLKANPSALNGTNLRDLSNSHYNTHGKKEGRSSLDELINFNRNLVKGQAFKRPWLKLDSTGRASVDITENGLYHYQPRVTPYTYLTTADKSTGTQTITLTVTSKYASVSNSASTQTAGKLLTITKIFSNYDGSRVIFYIGQQGDTIKPTSVKVTVISSSVNSIIPVNTVLFDYPSRANLGNDIRNVYTDEGGSWLGGEIPMPQYSYTGLVLVLRFTITSEGGTWTTSSTSIPSDYTFISTVVDVQG